MTTEELMDLMYTPIYDEKMLKVMEELEMEVPKLDEQYEMDLHIYAGDFKNKGIEFRFEEIDGKSTNGEPVLIKISLNTKMNKILPYNLSFGDSYKICSKKIGRNADYYDDFIDNIRYWIYNDSKKGTFLITLTYKDESLSELKSILFIKFDEDKDLDDDMIHIEE